MIEAWETLGYWKNTLRWKIENLTKFNLNPVTNYWIVLGEMMNFSCLHFLIIQ